VSVLLPGTGLLCDIGSGERCVPLRADLDALPLPEATESPFSSTADMCRTPAGTTRTPRSSWARRWRSSRRPHSRGG